VHCARRVADDHLIAERQRARVGLALQAHRPDRVTGLEIDRGDAAVVGADDRAIAAQRDAVGVPGEARVPADPAGGELDPVEAVARVRGVVRVARRRDDDERAGDHRGVEPALNANLRPPEYTRPSEDRASVDAPGTRDVAVEERPAAARDRDRLRRLGERRRDSDAQRRGRDRDHRHRQRGHRGSAAEGEDRQRRDRRSSLDGVTSRHGQMSRNI